MKDQPGYENQKTDSEKLMVIYPFKSCIFLFLGTDRGFNKAGW